MCPADTTSGPPPTGNTHWPSYEGAPISEPTAGVKDGACALCCASWSPACACSTSVLGTCDRRAGGVDADVELHGVALGGEPVGEQRGSVDPGV